MKSTAIRTAADQSATRASRRPPGVAKTGERRIVRTAARSRNESGHDFVEAATDKIDHVYNEFKLDLFTWISTNLKLRLSYTHTIKDDRVTAGISLIKK